MVRETDPASIAFWCEKKILHRKLDFSFLFMRANGKQLREITSLIDSSAIRSVVDQVFTFLETSQALAYVETGRSKGKVFVKI